MGDERVEGVLADGAVLVLEFLLCVGRTQDVVERGRYGLLRSY